MRSKMTPRKVRIGLKQREELNKMSGTGGKLGGDPLRRKIPHIFSD